MMAPNASDLLRSIPQIDRLLRHPAVEKFAETSPHREITESLRDIVKELRRSILDGHLTDAAEVQPAAICRALEQRLAERARPFYQNVLNATGVVLHTGLGRAPLAAPAVEALARSAQPQRVEINLTTGQRGGRDHGCARLLQELTGCEAATVVNNNAAATVVLLGALARGKKVLVSRGELVEIGGSYRIPDIMRESGAILAEVGTTNRTHERDYRAAIDADTGMILKVHASNYKIYGFTHEVELRTLVEIGRETDLPVVHDMGSGCLIDLAERGYFGEPTVQESLAAGADLVCFSGDKLLGGPQAGIIAGRRELVEQCKRHPLFRAVRPGRLIYTSLEATLKLYLQGDDIALAKIPTLAGLLVEVDDLKRRAEALFEQLTAVAPLHCQLAACNSQAGSGSLPTREFPSWCVRAHCDAVSTRDLARELRLGQPAILSRVQDDALVLDVRMLDEQTFPAIVQGFREVISRALHRKAT